MEIMDYINQSTNDMQRDRMKSLIDWTEKTFPEGYFEIKWNQPMFLLNNSYIIAYSYAKNHITVGCEGYELEEFREKIEEKYKTGKMTFKILNKEEVDFELLEDLIVFKMNDKKDATNFWK